MEQKIEVACPRVDNGRMCAGCGWVGAEVEGNNDAINAWQKMEVTTNMIAVKWMKELSDAWNWV